MPENILDDLNNAEDARLRQRAIERQQRLRARAERSSETQAERRGLVGTAQAVGKDVGRGITEAPMQILGGAFDAAREVLEFGHEADQWVASKIGYWPALNLDDPLERGLIVNMAAPDIQEREGLGKNIPEIRAPTTGTGGFIRGASQFLAPLGAVSKATKGIKVTTRFGRLTKMAGQGAVVDFVAFDPYADRLSDLLKDVPLGEIRPFFEWMATEDSALEGRAKNALEGTFLGVSTDLIMALGGAVIAMRRANVAARRAADQIQEEPSGAAEAARVQEASSNLDQKIDELTGTPSSVRPAADLPEANAAKAAEQAEELADEGRPAQDGEARPDAEPEPEPEVRADRPDLEEEIDGLVGPRFDPEEGADPMSVLRPRTDAEKAVDEIEGLPPMEARARAEEITGEKATSKARAIEAVRKFVGGAEKPYINTRMINGQEDLEEAIRNLADAYKEDAEIGVRKSAQVVAEAKEIDAFDSIFKEKKRPEALTDAEQYAVRELWASSVRQLINLARQAENSADPVVHFAFRRAMTMHRGIQAYAFEARAAAARNLRQWAIPVGENADVFRNIEEIIDSNGGVQASAGLAKRVAEAANAGNLRGVDNLVKRGWMRKTAAMVNEIGISAKLYAPPTHLINAGGNALMMYWETFNRSVAEGIGVASQTGVERGEAAAMMRGISLGTRDAFTEAVKSFRTGDRYAGGGKVELSKQSAFDPKTLEMKEGTLAAKAMKAIAVGVQFPFRMLNSGDVFFKVMNERAELYAQAMRQAVKEGGDDLEKTKELFAQYVETPTREMEAAAYKAAEENTFTTKAPPGSFARHLMALREKGSIIGYALLPFIQTPANILGYGVRSSPLAPVLSQKWRDAVFKSKGAERDIALARTATGSMMLFMAIDMALNGEITGQGPSINDPRRSAWLKQNQPYSVKIGGTSYQYNRADPFGLWLGTGADLAELLVTRDLDLYREREVEELLLATGFSVGQTFLNKTWMTGVADFLEAMQEPDRKSEAFLQRLVTGFIPSGVRALDRVNDPYLREARNVSDAVKDQMAFLSKTLAFKRDELGRPLDRSSGFGALYDYFSPIAVKQDRSEPIDREVLRLGTGIRKPDTTITITPEGYKRGYPINLRNEGEIYSRYLELSGQTPIDGFDGLNLTQFLNAVVSGEGPNGSRLRGRVRTAHRQYQEMTDGPQGEKINFIRNAVRYARTEANKQLYLEYQDYFDDQVSRREALNQRINDRQRLEQERQTSENPRMR